MKISQSSSVAGSTMPPSGPAVSSALAVFAQLYQGGTNCSAMGVSKPPVNVSAGRPS